jgi:hypothetical protein
MNLVQKAWRALHFIDDDPSASRMGKDLGTEL